MQIDRPIAIAVTLFVILLLIFFLVSPKYQMFKDLQIKLGEKKAEFNAKYAYFAEITRVYYELQSRGDNIKKIDDAFPTDSNYGRLVYFFQKKAMENGLIIKSLFLSKSSPAAQGSDLKEIVFSLDVMGSYSALNNFMASLEKSSRLFEVTSISFGSDVSGLVSETLAQFQIQQTYQFKLEVKTHSY